MLIKSYIPGPAARDTETGSANPPGYGNWNLKQDLSSRLRTYAVLTKAICKDAAQYDHRHRHHVFAWHCKYQ